MNRMGGFRAERRLMNRREEDRRDTSERRDMVEDTGMYDDMRIGVERWHVERRSMNRRHYNA